MSDSVAIETEISVADLVRHIDAKCHSPLTDRQKEILAFILEGCQKMKPPTIREIGAKFNISSPNGVSANIGALVVKGALQKDFGQSRALMPRHVKLQWVLE